MIEITVSRKINCGKNSCGKCEYVNYDWAKDGYYGCRLFNKGVTYTKSRPLRLPECIAAECKK